MITLPGEQPQHKSNLDGNMNAQDWAQEFQKLVPNGDYVDEYDLIAWFANALGCGQSHGFAEGCKASDTIRDLVRGDTRTVN